MGSDLETRIRHVTAVLGPTNTGKTHLAIERMLGHESGMIGLPLRLLAREVYDRIVARVGAERVALITGEEKIKPERARYFVCTVEAMPREIDVDFLAIDEIQLASDPERGHVFTDRLLNARGRSETLLLGAQTMRESINDLIPGANFISRPRLSKLSYAGEKKITRLPTRSAVVAFSSADVYSIAELIRRQRGGAAVVLGALSPRTRNAQVALYQSGDVDFLVATDAIGMGLNLDLDHVAFAAVRKFDGQTHRNLTPGEMAQIAGRAGRHMNDGTFGVTAGVEPLEADLVERLETHNFESVRVLQWRNRDLDLRTLDRLRDSLREMPREQRLTRARMADDVLALEAVSADHDIAALACSPAAVAKLWDVCQVPDYRKISPQSHAEMVATLYKFLMTGEEVIPEDWFSRQVELTDRTDGDIDTLANRIAHIRTWTFVSNRADWLKDPAHWQGRAREIEDKLSDALHECLTQRFVDKRTSALMRGMRDKDELAADIKDDGSVHVESHFVGRLKGFRFTPETQSDNLQGKAARHAAAQVVSRELGMRARRVAAAKVDAFKLTRDGRVLWREEEIARLEPAEDPLKPTVTLLTDEHLSGPDREKIQQRLDGWLVEIIGERLKPLVELTNAADVTGLGRGIAFRLKENFGILKRDTIAEEIKSLDQPARAQLRKYGVRFGAFNIYFPLQLKPAPAELAQTLWALKHAGEHGLARDNLPEPPRAGLTSVGTNAAVPEAFYRACGYHHCGPRAVRLDILERLADAIRPLLAWRPDPANPSMPPKGSTGDGGFTVTPEMMSYLGCSPEELGNVLKALGFRLERRPKKVIEPRPVPTAAPAPATEATDAGGVLPEVASTTGSPEVASTGSPEAAGAEASEAATIELGKVAAINTDTAMPVDDAGLPVVDGSATPPTAAEPTAAAETVAEAAPEAPATATVASGAGATVAQGEDKPAAAEPEMEDVWRPRRHKHERREHGEQKEGEGRPWRGRRERGGNRQRLKPGEQRPPQEAGVAAAPQVAAAAPGGGSAPAAPTAAADGDAQRPQGREHRRDDRREQGPGDRDRRRDGGGDGGRQRGDRHHARGEESGRGGRPGEGRGGGKRRPQRGDDRRAPEVHSAAPPRKGGGIDPDSPFAKLGALREQLEKRAKEPSSN